MASTLPPNILSYIGTFIDKKDQHHCALVCKHWTEPFLDAYWGRLKIGKYGMDINRASSNNACLINAHRVWAVESSGVNLYDYERLLKFQRSFPWIRHLQYDDYGPRIINILDGLDWRLWQSLTHIDITITYEYELIYFDNLFMKLSVLPCLVHLELDLLHGLAKQSPISWNDYESLHKHLTRLEYLKHNVPLKPITRDEIENIKTVEPAQTVTKIEFKKFNNLWFFYFTLKYPNLQHLIIEKYADYYNKDPIDYDPQQYQSDLQLFSTLDQFFPCLKRVDTTLGDKNIYSRFIFFETLGHFGTKIEHVNLRYGTGVKDDDVNRCLQPISESLKVLKIESGDEHVSMPFVVCPRLVTLCVNGREDVTIIPDEILECFPALRSLSVEKVFFHFFGKAQTYTPHPLHKLTIKESYTDNGALHYLSLHCSQLKHVTLVDIGYYKINTDDIEYEDYDEPGKWIVDMSMSNLDTFIFAFTDDLLRERQIFPRHYMIEQMENDNNGLQATQQSPRINWYHVYRDRTNRKEKISKWELGRRDIEFSQRYFKDFGRRYCRGHDRKDMEEDGLGFVQRRFWKKDLIYGVFVFRFKSVKNHIYRIKKLAY